MSYILPEENAPMFAVANNLMESTEENASATKHSRKMPSVSCVDNTELIAQLFESCENGDFLQFNTITERHPELDFNAKNAANKTLLQVAVEKNRNMMIPALLDKTDIKFIYIALLYSITKNYDQISEIIIGNASFIALVPAGHQHDGKRDFQRSFSVSHVELEKTFQGNPIRPPEGLSVEDFDAFSPDVTPIILAAQKNQYKILQHLLEIGDFIPQPHHLLCNCHQCISLDMLRKARSRLETYRALCSPSYILLTCPDPIYAAMKLQKEMEKLSDFESYYRSEYIEIQETVNEFLSKMLDNVRNDGEMSVLLNKGVKTEEFPTLARLQLACDSHAKQFIKNPLCQQKLLDNFFTGSAPFARRAGRGLILLAIWIFHPLAVAASVFGIKLKISELYHYPWIRLAVQALNLLLFSAILITLSLQTADMGPDIKEFPEIYTNVLACRQNLECVKVVPIVATSTSLPTRLSSILALDWIVILFFLSLVIEELAELELVKFKLSKHFEDFNNKLGMKIDEASDYLSEEESWSVENATTRDQLSRSLYWLIADRFYWEPLDPQFVAEGLFAVANFCTIFRLLSFLAIHSSLGPMKVSLSHMISDIVTFGTVYVVIFCAFFLALLNIYGFQANLADDSDRDAFTAFVEKDNYPESFAFFGSAMSIAQSMMWSLLSMGTNTAYMSTPYGMRWTSLTQLKTNFTLQDDGTYTVDLEGIDLGDTAAASTLVVTGYFGMIFWILFNFFTMVVMLNMLVAMMSQSFEKITDDSDMEWKFARTSLYLEYITFVRRYPLPWNVLTVAQPIVNGLSSLLSLLLNIYKIDLSQTSQKEAQLHVVIKNCFGLVIHTERILIKTSKQNGLEQNEIANKIQAYEKLMNQLAIRYIFQQTEVEEVGQTDDGTAQLNQELQKLSFFVHSAMADLTADSTELRHRSTEIWNADESIKAAVDQVTSVLKATDDQVVTIKEAVNVMQGFLNNRIENVLVQTFPTMNKIAERIETVADHIDGTSARQIESVKEMEQRICAQQADVAATCDSATERIAELSNRVDRLSVTFAEQKAQPQQTIESGQLLDSLSDLQNRIDHTVSGLHRVERKLDNELYSLKTQLDRAFLHLAARDQLMEQQVTAIKEQLTALKNELTNPPASS